jgi:hypothetical protein
VIKKLQSSSIREALVWLEEQLQNIEKKIIFHHLDIDNSFQVRINE